MNSRFALAAAAGALPQHDRPRWLQEHFQQQFPDLSQRQIRDSLFYQCRFQKLTKASLIRCSFPESSFEPQHLIDLLGLTLTLDCYTFQGLRLNELALDAVLWLLNLTSGNEQKLRQLMDLVNPAHREQCHRVFEMIARR